MRLPPSLPPSRQAAVQPRTGQTKKWPGLTLACLMTHAGEAGQIDDAPDDSPPAPLERLTLDRYPFFFVGLLDSVAAASGVGSFFYFFLFFLRAKKGL